MVLLSGKKIDYGTPKEFKISNPEFNGKSLTPSITFKMANQFEGDVRCWLIFYVPEVKELEENISTSEKEWKEIRLAGKYSTRFDVRGLGIKIDGVERNEGLDFSIDLLFSFTKLRFVLNGKCTGYRSIENEMFKNPLEIINRIISIFQPKQ